MKDYKTIDGRYVTITVAIIAIIVTEFVHILLPVSQAQMENLWSESPYLELRGHKDVLSCIHFSPSGKKLLSNGNDGFVRVWDISSGKLLHEYEIHMKSTYVNYAEFLSEEEIVSCGDDGTIRKYNLETKRASLVIKDMSGEVLSFCIVPDRPLIVSEGAAAIRVWSSTSGQLLQTVAEGVLTRCIVTSARGDFILAGRYDGYVQYWNLESNTTESVYDDADNLSICLSPSNQVAFVGCKDGLIRPFEITPFRALKVVRNIREGSINDLCLDGDGKRLVWCANGYLGYGSSEIVVYDLINRKYLWNAVCQNGSIISIAISPSADVIAAAGEFGSSLFSEHVVYLWKVKVEQTN